MTAIARRLTQLEQRWWIAPPAVTEAGPLAPVWSTIARPSQMPPPGDWRTWLILAGRGWGKTRTGAECVRAWVHDFPLVNLIAPTADDARDVMVEGESGLLSICAPWERPRYFISKRRLEWPNGARTLIFTADEPDRLRGKQHQRLWMDELAAWKYPESFDQAMFGLRLGPDPRAVVTTTPRPTAIIKQLATAETTVLTRGTSWENQENLAPEFFSAIVHKYHGTSLGRQELEGQILEDREGALWQRQPMIEAHRVTETPDIVRVVVGIDPSTTDNQTSAEAGIIIAGRGTDGHGYVLGDESLRGSPHQWASAAAAAYHRFKADRVIAEVNQGGLMVETTLRTVAPNVAYKAVHAAKGKVTRAEPVSALYEQGRVHHLGTFPDLEDQLCQWVPGEKSPDRLDALVWAMTELFNLNEPAVDPLMGYIVSRGVKGW